MWPRTRRCVLRSWREAWDIAAGVLLVREAGGRVTDFRGAGTGPLDARGIASRQIIAGNIKITEPLQKTIVSSGYAKTFA